MQTFTAPIDGVYKLEVWGAQGDSWHASIPGGRGGYAKGIYSMSKGQDVYVAIGGGIGETWNGGGVVDSGTNISPSGGGATSIQKSLISDGQLYCYESVKDVDVLVVAGGGGGTEWVAGGYGGGTDGGEGESTAANGSILYGGKGGTQSSGGNSAPIFANTKNIFNGSFGRGGYTSGGDGAGQGGGGWYGGGAADFAGGGGGGSGHIGTMLTNGNTIAGNQTFPSPSGGTETGHSGNGYAIISWISPSL